MFSVVRLLWERETDDDNVPRTFTREVTVTLPNQLEDHDGANRSSGV